MYVVQLVPVSVERDSMGSGFHELAVIETGLIVPSVNDSRDGTPTLTLTIQTTLNTNTFYQATLITTMDMVEAGDFQFCKKVLQLDIIPYT